MSIKPLPTFMLAGSTVLQPELSQAITSQPNAVRRINSTCVELESYANVALSGHAGMLGVSILIPLICAITLLSIVETTPDMLLAILITSPIIPLLAFLNYLVMGAHRIRGSYIRVNRITRKVYFISPLTPGNVHAVDWNRLVARAGHISRRSSYGPAYRRPLFLIGVDYTLVPPTELCIAFGNTDMPGDERSAQTLWGYLQHFMEYGVSDLPDFVAPQKKLSRRDAATQPYREWYTGVCTMCDGANALLWAPIMIPIWIFLLAFKAYPDSVEAWIQHKVPYTTFPHEIDIICGFDTASPVSLG